jgi:hypothetical protein
MAWVTPRTWVLNELVDPTKMNTIQSNFNELWKYTTAGDILYAGTSTSLSRLPIGTTNQVLKVVGGVPVWTDLIPQTILFTEPKTNASWNGSSKSANSYDITANSFNSDIPTSAKGIIAFITAKWATSGSGYNIHIKTKGATNPVIYLRNDTNYYLEKQATIPLDSNGVFTVVVQTATCDYVKIHIVGYIL